jgi:hypothetical protein
VLVPGDISDPAHCRASSRRPWTSSSASTSWSTTSRFRRRAIDYAVVLSNVGLPVRLRAGAWTGELGPARTLLLPAVLGEVEIMGPAAILTGYPPI